MTDKELQSGGGEQASESGEPREHIETNSEDKALAPCQPTDQDESEIEESEADAGDSAAQLKDQLLRALAETENVRRRARKDVTDANRYGIANFARDMLSVSDNMGRALDSIPDDAREESEIVKAIAEGVEMTAREMTSTLERHGVRQVNPLGEKFDYNLHQAMFEAKDSGQPDGTIVEVVQAGYMIGERLLRPAMVGVAKGGSAAPSDDADGASNSSEDGADEDDANLGAKLDTTA
ncbi:MAG: nucleotide exchange factor GrpE [Proteobacteria bacterium]|nr:nucleotide exchange factor GrpE [Pseudomonadota bacterium]MDA1356238.1 nucleotide exchange factor GrpE [Pseudomonadota bacterium]